MDGSAERDPSSFRPVSISLSSSPLILLDNASYELRSSSCDMELRNSALILDPPSIDSLPPLFVFLMYSVVGSSSRASTSSSFISPVFLRYSI